MPTDSLVGTLGEGRSERREGRCPLTRWWVQWGGEIREEVPTDSYSGEEGKVSTDSLVGTVGRGDQRGGGGGGERSERRAH